jgi:predicted ATPase/DNA-binding CsgD family transcriptional regulator
MEPDQEAVGMSDAGPDDDTPVTSGEMPTSSPSSSARSAGVPTPVTSFVGRSRELAELEALFVRARLITITGSGGSGKTRLAMEFAARRLASSTTLYLVDLAPITDAALLPVAIAAVLGVREVAGEDAIDTLARRLGDREVVWVLDNLEHLPAAGAIVADSLAKVSGLRVIATSRAPLHIRGEHEYPLAPLTLPEADELASPATLAEVESVKLFVERARAVQPGFELTDENAAAVAAICARLDGLPLAIELAAARTRLFSPASLLTRLEHRLRVLTDGPTDAPTRQRALRSTIAWSFDLLSEPHQRVFGALGVFAGSFSLAGAEAVVDLSTPDVLTSLEHLVDQSVLSVGTGADGEPRFRVLETIREFAWDQVPGPGRIALRDRHLAHFVALAERSEAHLRGPEQAAWIGRLAADQADIRAALAWAQEAHRDESLVRLAAALRRRFWYEAGGSSEGMRWLEAAMDVGSAAPSGIRAKAMQRAAWIVWEMGDGERSQELFEASLETADEEDHLGRFEALIGLSYRALGTGGPGLEIASLRMGQAIEHARRAGTPEALVEPLTAQGHLAKAQGDLESARAHFEEALAIARRVEDIWGAGSALLQQGTLALEAGDASRAEPLLAESARLSAESGDREVLSHATAALAQALTAQGELGAARSQLLAGGEVVHEMENPLGDMLLLEASAGWLASAARLPAAIEAWARAEGYRAAHQWSTVPEEERTRHRARSVARAEVGTIRFELLWAAGESRDLREAVDVAIEAVGSTDLQDLPAVSIVAQRGRFDLTPREQEVLALVAAGMTDGEIAESLVISKKTASVHVANIKSKLGASSRVEVATIALRESLA